MSGLDMYHEIHGSKHGGVPLRLLHGALGTLDMFGPLLPALAQTRRVIAVEQQRHGRTADIIRPEGAVELFRLRGGGVPGDFVPMPPARLAVLPGTAHITLPTRTEWLRSMITEFLDTPMPATDERPAPTR